MKTHNLFCIIVDEKHRGQGIGKQLMDSVEMACRHEGIFSIKLDSGLQRDQTHKFYESFGYEKKCYTFEKQINI